MENTHLFNSKKIKIASLCALASLSVFFVSKTITEVVHYGDRDSNSQGSFTVSGEGEQFAIADVANFSFSVVEEGKDVADASEKVTTKNNAAIKYLKDKGIESRDIKTISFDASPKYDYSNNTSRIVGYMVTQSVSVKVRKTSDAGQILSGIGSLGVSNISGLSFTLDDDSLLRDKARSLAIQNAQEKAERLAKDLGVTLDGVVSFYEEQDNNPQPFFREDAVFAKVEKKAMVPQIELGQNKVRVVVNVTYRTK